MRAASYTDEDRIRLARPFDCNLDRMNGPAEVVECDEHPAEVEIHRWVWDRGSTPEDGDAEILADCPKCVEMDEGTDLDDAIAGIEDAS